MTFFTSVALAGILGTTMMIAVMSLINHLKWVNADMVRAIGSMFTHSYANAFFPGLICHYTAGISFAFIYALFMSSSTTVEPSAVILMAMCFGLVHGLWVGLLLEILVAEHHPLEQFRKVGLGVVAGHVIGHVFYGVTVGFALSYRWASVTSSLETLRFNIPLADVMGFSLIWMVLFGMPLAFVGYVSYVLLTTKRTGV